MIFCIAVSAGLSALLCFLGKRAGVLDSGDGERKLQTSPAVPIGGVAIYSAFMLSMTLQNVSGKLPFSGAPTVVPIPTVQSNSLLAFLAFSGGGVALFGFLDDLRPMKPAIKLLLQSVCLALGIPLFSAASGAGGISLFLLFLFLILSINVYNLIDGIDGLCASVCAVSFCILAVSTGFSGCVLLFFAALGFLPFNLPPARCYLGDSGSQFLGLALGACILCDAQWGKTFSPFLLILLPAADAVRVALFRLARGASPVSADRSHLHHILADRFLGNGGTVLFYALLTALSGIPCLLG